MCFMSDIDGLLKRLKNIEYCLLQIRSHGFVKHKEYATIAQEINILNKAIKENSTI